MNDIVLRATLESGVGPASSQLRVVQGVGRHRIDWLVAQTMLDQD